VSRSRSVRNTFIQPVRFRNPVASASRASASCSVTQCSISFAYTCAIFSWRAGREWCQYFHRNGARRVTAEGW